jgi:hypothetical protein
MLYFVRGYYSIGTSAIYFIYILFDEDEIRMFAEDQRNYNENNMMNMLTADHYAQKSKMASGDSTCPGMALMSQHIMENVSEISAKPNRV